MTKKIGQVLGGSGDAGACHQLVNHLVQLGYKVKATFSSILDKHQECFPIVLGEQVSEGFDGQTRTELLEAGNELDRVKVNSESSHQSHLLLFMIMMIILLLLHIMTTMLGIR